ncbi:hypothetical protein HN51_068515 [Arachis hypogaea]|uniref:Reticulon-like protein n=1 Tax=Arachis hypogaea TaxID=3818 RepID=A0A444ZA23_ARAHY|nr:reticulon-like protein B13 [Arachis ipaensis]XP_025652790.1 reticulon-like protein B13 [Arachis hypogaea]QHO10563.1 Reticulon-like protein [Arachis hypogaea]RYR11027.1 hypothetical protein Ahy_B05g079520 [Arachis hypogaea]
MSAQPEPVMPSEPEPEAESQVLTTTPSHSSPDHVNGNNVVKDVVLWRRKKLNATLLILATATWVSMQLYQFKFITLISWLAIFLLASIFLYANLTKLFGKEPPRLTRFELTEETVMGMAHTIRVWIEEAIRLLFWVGAEKEWHVFVGVEVGLLLLSYVGTFMDLLTFLYIGTIVSMTVPVAYVKYEDKVQRLVNWLRERCNKSYQVIDERAIQKIKTKVMNGKDNKEKKTQ